MVAGASVASVAVVGASVASAAVVAGAAVVSTTVASAAAVVSDDSSSPPHAAEREAGDGHDGSEAAGTATDLPTGSVHGCPVHGEGWSWGSAPQARSSRREDVEVVGVDAQLDRRADGREVGELPRVEPHLDVLTGRGRDPGFDARAEERDVVEHRGQHQIARGWGRS